MILLDVRLQLLQMGDTHNSVHLYSLLYLRGAVETLDSFLQDLTKKTMQCYFVRVESEQTMQTQREQCWRYFLQNESLQNTLL
jgi:hypothetical protein